MHAEGSEGVEAGEKQITQKKRWKQGFKVVSVMDGKVRSFCNWDQFAITYPQKRAPVRHPGCGPLSVFSLLEHAENFLHDKGSTHMAYYQHKLYRVKYLPSRTRRLGLWYFRRGHEGRYSDNLPEGTVFADKVRLLGPVD